MKASELCMNILDYIAINGDNEIEIHNFNDDKYFFIDNIEVVEDKLILNIGKSINNCK